MKRSTDVTKITKAQARNSTISPARLAVEAALKNTATPIDRLEIAALSKVDEQKVSVLLQVLGNEGKAARRGKNSAGRLLWLWVDKDNRATNTQTRPAPHVNSNQRAAKPGELMGWATQQPIRPGADDHKRHASRGFPT